MKLFACIARVVKVFWQLFRILSVDDFTLQYSQLNLFAFKITRNCQMKMNKVNFSNLPMINWIKKTFLSFINQKQKITNLVLWYYEKFLNMCELLIVPKFNANLHCICLSIPHNLYNLYSSRCSTDLR